MKSMLNTETSTMPDVVEILYERYLEQDDQLYIKTVQEDNLSRIGGEMDDMANAGEVTTEAIANHGEVALRAGFYAGFRAASLIQGGSGFDA